ncbi:MAG: 2-hydroxyacyl-CoA dehydratase family protein [Anaerolineae bacterium]|nr:2-hydroxyacyl-CoA dehydratase family protein [Anaerolineae bacterium]MDW8101406.1 2-hydroxyacyl-CoA dehydratase family protein [Anaerolineae bacterium]
MRFKADRAFRCLKLLAPILSNPQVARLAALLNSSGSPHERVAQEFSVRLAGLLYSSPPERIVWANILVPSELIWGLGFIPFYPEIAAATIARFGLAPEALRLADELGVPRDLCSFHRAAIGFAEAGFFPKAGAFVAVNYPCWTAAVFLSWEAFRHNLPFYLIDMPSDFTEDSAHYLAYSLEEVAQGLASTRGNRYYIRGIEKALRLSNEARSLALEATEMRKFIPSPLKGSKMIGHLGLIAYLFGSPYGVAYYRAMRDYIRRIIAESRPEQEKQGARLYWMHLKPFYSTTLFHLVEDEKKAVIVFEEHSSVWWEPLVEGEPFLSLARKMLSHPSLGPTEGRIARALADVQAFKADGVIHFNHWGCRQSQGAIALLRRRLRGEGVPLLELEGDCIDENGYQEGQIRVRMEAFLESLGGGL